MGADAVSRVNKVHFKNYRELIEDLRKANIESLQAAIFIDFSESNTTTGKLSYGCSLHDVT